MKRRKPFILFEKGEVSDFQYFPIISFKDTHKCMDRGSQFFFVDLIIP